MRPGRLVAVVAVVVLALSVTACGAVPIAEPTASRSTHAASPSPAPAPTKPALGELVIGPDGLGPLVLGQPVPAAADDLALVRWDPGACTDVGIAAGQPYAGQWLTTYPDDPDAPLMHDPFRIAVEGGVRGGRIQAVQVNSPRIRTATGIHVGSTAAELRAAYPSLVPQAHGLYTDLYVVDSAIGRLFMEVYDGSADAQGSTAVALIFAFPAGTPARTSIPGDAVVGCPV